jgi:hypothetical protein
LRQQVNRPALEPQTELRCPEPSGQRPH